MTAVLPSEWSPPLRARWTDPALARAVEANLTGRIATFIRDEESEPLAFFTPAWREGERSGDWYGEHAGKWLLAASAAYRRTADPEIERSLRTVVRFLLDNQESTGYLGTYAADSPSRFTHPEAANSRTWDLWIHSWLILGLLEAANVLQEETAKGAAQRIGDLILASFPADQRSILDLGNHAGLSSAVLIEPMARLTLATGDAKYATFARQIVDEMEARNLRVFSDAGGDPATLGTGKVYQILWVLLGLTALHRATGDRALLRAAESWADSIAAHHLNPLGGPWGGFGGHKEVFAPRGAFDVGGLVETCSTATWMALNRELALLTGDARHTERYERSLHNALLGAALLSSTSGNGEDWSYFTFANGRPAATYHWACCKSSGAMALELSPTGIMSARDRTIRIDLPISGEATFLIEGHEVIVVQEWDATGGKIIVQTVSPIRFELQIRVPAWARLLRMNVPMTRGETDVPGEEGTLRLTQEWTDGDRVEIVWELPTCVHPFTHSVDHHGQEIVRDDYAFLSRGPWVYATGLYDGFRKQETLRLPRLDPSSPFTVSRETRGEFGPLIALRIPNRPPIAFLPYAEAGGRSEGGWRAAWLQIAWQ